MIKKKETIFSLEKYDIEHKKYETIKTICRSSLTLTYITYVVSPMEKYSMVLNNKFIFKWNSSQFVNILLICSLELDQIGENGIEKRGSRSFLMGYYYSHKYSWRYSIFLSWFLNICYFIVAKLGNITMRWAIQIHKMT